SLTKYKRVTQSILALKIYSIVSSVNITITILITLNIVIERLSLLLIVLIIYTNLYSLYECLIKLKITNKKHFIINIIALC
ncbi:hypothetical protein BU23DRAFT_459374, partial [Bimuria novae-zelandiae CBS 107.79]